MSTGLPQRHVGGGSSDQKRGARNFRLKAVTKIDGFMRKFTSFLEREVKAREVSVFMIEGRAVRTAGGIDEVILWKQERRTFRLMFPRNDLRFAVSMRYFTLAVGLSYFSRSLVGRMLV